VETQKRHIKSGVEFERYFSEAMGNNELIKRNSTLDDTVIFLPEAILDIPTKVTPLLRMILTPHFDLHILDDHSLFFALQS
jgi:hypothetical protein